VQIVQIKLVRMKSVYAQMYALKDGHGLPKSNPNSIDFPIKFFIYFATP